MSTAGIEELKIELTDACQARCSFCHQRGEARRVRIGSMGRTRRSPHLLVTTVREWLAWAARQGISTVRFTGGEPTLHPHMLDFCQEAHGLGLKVIVNTNGLYGFTIIEALSRWVTTCKVSVPTLDGDACDRLTGVKGSLHRKLDTVMLALEQGMEVEMLTAMVPENIDHVEAFMRLQEDLPGVLWVPLRLESSPEVPRPLTSGMMQQMAEEIDRAQQAFPGRDTRLHLATPFCAVRPVELGARVFSGRAEDCGPYCSLTVTSSGTLAACYSCRQPIQAHEHLASVLAEREIVELTKVERLPASCRSCEYVARCMGGCASPHATVERDGGRVDYLALEGPR